MYLSIESEVINAMELPKQEKYYLFYMQGNLAINNVFLNVWL